jgi:hypothetical protein
LAGHQFRWIRFLNENGIAAELIRVVPTDAEAVAA